MRTGRTVAVLVALIATTGSVSLASARTNSLGGPGGFEVLANFETSDAWVTDPRGRATGRPPWAVARGWQVNRIPGSDYSGPHEDQFLLPRGSYVLHVRVHDTTFPSRILVQGRTVTGAPLAPAVCFYLVEPLDDATLTLRFASDQDPRGLRLVLDRRSDGRVDETLRPKAVVTTRGAIGSDYDGPKLRLTARRSTAGFRITVSASDRAGIAGVYDAIDEQPLARYQGPFDVPPQARVFVLAGDGLGNTSVVQRRAATLPRG